MLELLQSFDQSLFQLVNQQWTNAIFDAVLPVFRDKMTWVPLYALLLFLLPYRYGKSGVYLIVLVAIAVGLSDLISSSLVKPYIERLRPCKNPQLLDEVRLLVNCGSGKSFTSSHAANHFSLAAALCIPLRKFRSFLLPVALIWAAMISYAQVYVGVHYPLDVVAGALLGLCLGAIFGLIAEDRLPVLTRL